MDLEFAGPVVFWKGPAPWYFVSVPEEEADEIEATSSMTSYGWGCIPVRAQIGETAFKTSLFPKDGGYLVPVKVDVRRRERIELGDTVSVRLVLNF